MRLLDELRAEHELIERVVGSLQAFAASPDRDLGEGDAYLRFFRLYAGRFHHAREEDTLFPALVRETGCVSCEAYGEGCLGVEREWWTELEWEDVHDRIG